MSKDALDRIADTLLLVKGQNGRPNFPDDHYKAVADSLDARLAGLSPAKKILLSGHMSFDKVKNKPGDAPSRRVLRAAILLDLALAFEEKDWAQQAALQINLGNRNAWEAFDFALNRARNAVLSEPRYIDMMLSELRSDPVKLLKKHLITLDGGSKAGNPLTYRVWYDSTGYRLSCYGVSGGYTLKAVNVMGTAYKDIKDTPGGLTPVDSGVDPGCDLMFTTQFTGCSFCFMKSTDGTSMLAAHIDPGKGQGAVSGSELSDIMRKNGGFTAGNGGDFKVYGRVPNKSDLPGYPESAGSMTIVGVRNGTEWRLYSQIKGLDGKVVSAQRIDTISNAAKFRG